MTLRFHSRLTVDGKQAKVEIKGTAAELDRLGKELGEVSRGGKGAKASLDQISGAARAASGTLSQASVEVGKLRDTHRSAAGSVGNLRAQFNDIGVMLAAGQNPRQLAIQQGTQITQVIGPMGAAGAARAARDFQ